MRTITGIGTPALLALMVVGLSSRAQEAISPATATGGDAAGATVSSQPPTSASGNSKVRIVRLSEVKGAVQLDRQTGKGFESAMANLPVIEGEKLKTADGVAEIEFEDNSTVRVAQNSEVAFPRLELLPSGAKASSVNVLKGTVYVSLVNTKGNEFTLTAGENKINLPPDSHVRLQLTQDQASLAVLHGQASVEEPSGSTSVDKNKTMTFNLAGEGQPTVAKSVAQEPLDSWDNSAVQYHKSFASTSSFGTPYAYGVNDMNYYGSFVNGAGCGGSMWRPYFASASWDPYSSGAWAYYPSAGYSWVSPYPWGWTPYHYGSWAFCQGTGWGWRAGGAWMGLANNSFVSSPGLTTRPQPPLRPPTTSEVSLVPVNLKAIPASSLGPHDTFVFRKDSAGLGIPRGSFGKLNSFSGQAVHHGMASTAVYYGAEHGAAAGGERSSFSGSASSDSRASSSSYSSSMRSASGSAGSHASSASSGGSGRR